MSPDYRRQVNESSARLNRAINDLRESYRADRLNARSREDMAASKTKLTGEIRVNGAGETKTNVTFPIQFTEKPVMNFGAEMIEGDAIIDGFMPTISVVILGWVTKDLPPTQRLYLGATLGIVVGGAHFNKLSVHWSVEGTALSNPV